MGLRGPSIDLMIWPTLRILPKTREMPRETAALLTAFLAGLG